MAVLDDWGPPRRGRLESPGSGSIGTDAEPAQCFLELGFVFVTKPLENQDDLVILVDQKNRWNCIDTQFVRHAAGFVVLAVVVAGELVMEGSPTSP